MPYFVRWSMLGVLLLVTLCGCSDEGKSESSTDVNLETTIDELGSERDSLVGRWLLVQVRMGENNPLLLFEFAKGDGDRLEASIVTGSSTLIADPVLQSSEVLNDHARLSVQIKQITLDFDGRLNDEGVVLGTTMLNGTVIDSARLIATEDTDMDGAEPFDEPSMKELGEASGAPNRFEALGTFIEAHPESPLAFDASQARIGLSGATQADAETVEAIAEKYLEICVPWGPRMVHAARVDIAANLAATRYLPELALKYAQQAEEDLPPGISDEWRLRINVAKGRALLSSGDEEKMRQGAELLRAYYADNKMKKDVIKDLAEYEKDSGDIDEAITLYGKLVAIPPTGQENRMKAEAQRHLGTVDPASVWKSDLAKLWLKKHGNMDGHSEFLDDIYRESIENIEADEYEQRAQDEKNHVALCEIFTGSFCPPCVAPDIAADILERTFQQSELVVMRYHQHFPGPDPLANSDAEGRWFYYKSNHTPDVFINGEEANAPGGFLGQIPVNYAKMRSQIQPALKLQTRVKISLSAEQNDGVVKLSASVGGIPPTNEYIRLRLALVENDVSFDAPNGVRIHNMVVRHMPGGAEGTGSKEGGLAYQGEVNLDQLRKKLREGLEAVEVSRNFEFTQMPFRLENLKLVGILQDDFTKRVIQSTVIPVAGSPSSGHSEAEVSQQPPAAAKPGNEQPDESVVAPKPVAGKKS